MPQISKALKGFGPALLGVIVLLGCAGREVPIVLVQAPTVGRSPESDYVVQAGDTLDVRFYYHPDHNLSDVVVRPDGKMELPLVGEIQAAGMTPPQIASLLVERYSTNLRDPKIAVNVKTLGESQVYVGGEVRRPGVVKLKPNMNAVQAILEAGGPLDTADIERVVLIRAINDTQLGVRELNIKEVLTRQDLSHNEMLAQDDMLFIPQTGIARANVWMDQYIRRMLPFGPPVRPPTIQ